MTIPDTTITPERIREIAASGPKPATPPPQEIAAQEFTGHREEGRAYFKAPGGKIYSVPEAEAGTALAAEQSLAPATAEDVARWRNRPGAIETTATQFGRGVLDALLAPGALLGAGAEGVGELFDSETLRDFGRELGNASSGSAAIEAGSFVAHGGVQGGSARAARGEAGQRALGGAEATRERVAEQERDWPLLSTLSRMAGMATFAAGTGGLASGGASGLQMAGVAAAEGAAGGAQAAYEQSAPLRDVLTSTFLGAAIGGGLGLGAIGAQKVAAAGGKYLKQGLVEGGLEAAGDLAGGAKGLIIENAPAAAEAAANLSRSVRNAFGQGVEELAARPETAKIISFFRRAAEDAKAAIKRSGVNPEARMEAAKLAATEATERAAAKAGFYDAAEWATKAPTPIQKLGMRAPILNRVSADLSDDFARLKNVRPSLNFTPNVERMQRLTRGIDETAAIGSLQQRLEQAATSLPNVSGDAEISSVLMNARNELSRGGAAEAAVVAHRTSVALEELAARATSDVASSAASRTSREILDELSSTRWGRAGQLYRDLRGNEGAAARVLGDKAQMRNYLRRLDGRGQLGKVLDQEADSIERALVAQRNLTGDKTTTGFRQAIRELKQRASRAEEAVTIDGGPAGVALDYLRDNAGSYAASRMVGMAVGGSIGGFPGAAVGFMVANKIRPSLQRLMPHILPTVKAAAAVPKAALWLAKPEPYQAAHSVAAYLTTDEKRKRYDDRADLLARTLASPDARTNIAKSASEIPGIPEGMHGAVARDSLLRMDNLLREMPKPLRGFGGAPEASLSRTEIERAEAMWDATFDPDSIFEDFDRGVVNYEKIQYVWRQYPGKQQAMQAGIVDMLNTQLGEDERARIPHNVLSQIDNMFGFDGRLQTTVSGAFSARTTTTFQQAAQQQAQQPPRRMLKVPDTAQTYTQRLAQRS